MPKIKKNIMQIKMQNKIKKRTSTTIIYKFWGLKSIKTFLVKNYF